MLSYGRRFVILLIIICLLLIPACSSGNAPTESLTAPEATTSEPSQPTEPTKSEPTSGPPTITSLPPATATENPTQTQELGRRGEIYLVTDEFDAVVYNIPIEWGEYDASPWLIDGQVVGSSISASSDLKAYLDWGAPGISIYVSRRLDKGYLQMMEEFGNIFAESCDEYLSIWDYENDVHRGRRQRFWRCGGEDGPTLDLVALVDKEDWQAYTAIVVIVWFYPVEFQLTEDYLLSFMVTPENLP